MKIRYLFLTLFSLICFSVSSQEDSFQEKILDYLKVNGTYTQYNNAYDQMFAVFKERYALANVPEEVWIELIQDKEKNVSKIISLLTSAYRKHFSEENIRDLYAFYNTEAGKKIQVDSSTLTPEQSAEVSLFYQSPTGQKLFEVQSNLAQDIIQISEYWSTDLYIETMDILSSKGYNITH